MPEMRVPLSWLKEFVDITIPVEELALRMTLAGLEVNAIERIGADWERDKIVVGQVVAVRPHPNADSLVLADVEYGRGAPQTVVTGAPAHAGSLGFAAGPVSKLRPPWMSKEGTLAAVIW